MLVLWEREYLQNDIARRFVGLAISPNYEHPGRSRADLSIAVVVSLFVGRNLIKPIQPVLQPSYVDCIFRHYRATKPNV